MPSPALTPDKLLLNANILTVDPLNPRAEALAIKGGKFVAVGANKDVEHLAGPGTKVINLAGKTVVPGFIDAHIHVMSTGCKLVSRMVDCELPTIGLVQEELRLKARETPPGEWVMGFKYDDTKTPEGRMPSRWELDEVSRDHPVIVTHRAGLKSSVNEKGLEVFGVTRDSAGPISGPYEKDPESGEPNGVLYEAGEERIRFFLMSQVDAEERRQGLKTITSMYVAAGLTSVHDAMVTPDEVSVYQDSWEHEELPLRVYMLVHENYFEAFRKAGIRTGLGDDKLKWGGIKLTNDGGIATRTAYLSQPYIGTDDHGLMLFEQDELDEKIQRIHEAGYQTCVHSNGDAAIDMTLKAFERAQAGYPRQGARHRIEHCTVVNPDLLRRIKALGVVPTPFGAYAYQHGEKMAFYGEERARWMFAHRSFLDYGIPCTGASDFTASPFEPLLGIQCCTTRTDSEGRVWGPNQRLSVEEALKIYTLNGAYASFEENIKGSITPGKLADLVVLAQDPISVDPLSIKDIPIEMTMVGGDAVYEG